MIRERYEIAFQGELRIRILPPTVESCRVGIARVVGKKSGDAISSIEKTGGKVLCWVDTIDGDDYVQLEFDFAGSALTGSQLADIRKGMESIVAAARGALRYENAYLAVTLDLSRTRIGDSSMDELCSFKDAVKAQKDSFLAIDLSFSRITDRGLRAFTSARDKTITQLDLSSTEVGDDGVEFLANLTSLEHLVLARTKVSDGGLCYLAGLAELETLDLSNTRIGDTGLTHLAGLAKLNKMNLSGTSITDVGVPSIPLTSMTKLDLSSTNVGDATLRWINAKASQIKTLDRSKTILGALDISKTRITDRGLGHLVGISSSLKSLALSGTYIGDDGLALIAGLINLETLALSSTRVGNGGLDELKNLKRLKQLDLSETHISDEGLLLLGKIAFPSPAKDSSRRVIILDRNKISHAAIENLRRDFRIGSPRWTVYALPR